MHFPLFFHSLSIIFSPNHLFGHIFAPIYTPSMDLLELHIGYDHMHIRKLFDKIGGFIFGRVRGQNMRSELKTPNIVIKMFKT